MHLFLTLAFFVLTLVLLFVRPRGLHEAWATVIGGGLMLIFGLVTWAQAWQMIVEGKDVLFFLFTLMLLSALLDKSGFFEWAAIHAARAARGSGPALYRNVFLLGAVTTAFLSLDTTAIILTPVVLAFVMRLKLNSKPFLFACAFVANTASLLLPVSNLTNLLFASAFHLPFAQFALNMALPQLVVLVANYLLFRWWFRREIPKQFQTDHLPEPKSVLPDPPFFYGALVVLGFVFVGYFIGSLRGIPPYQIALAGCAGLLVWAAARKQVDGKVWHEISWPLFPFVIGLFVVVRGVESLGIAPLAAQGLHHVGQSTLPQILATAFGGGLGSNVVNNIPMALLAISVLEKAHLPAAAQYGALLGCNLGPNLAVTGSLATMLVITGARKRGEDIGAWQFFKVGVVVTPILLLAASLALWAVCGH
jgi:arsenical pump membrane protein